MCCCCCDKRYKTPLEFMFNCYKKEIYIYLLTLLDISYSFNKPQSRVPSVFYCLPHPYCYIYPLKTLSQTVTYIYIYNIYIYIYIYTYTYIYIYIYQLSACLSNSLFLHLVCPSTLYCPNFIKNKISL